VTPHQPAASAALGFPVLDPALAERLETGLARVEDALGEAVDVSDPLMAASASYLLKAGGKRIRPLLVLLAAALGRADVTDEIVRAGTVVELTHVASLYHDDVMDEAVTRRGLPAAQGVYGNSVAVITGDYLFARASSLCVPLGPEAVSVHSSTFMRLCLGQLHETVGPAADADPVAHYLQVLSDKTGSLIAASVELGGLLGGTDRAHVQALVRYAEKVGVAFQLADDVIDVVSDAETSGKTPGIDLREGVPTMPTLLLAQAGPESAPLRDRLAGDLSSEDALASAVAALREDPVIDRTREMAREWADAAIAELEPLPDSSVRDALVAFAIGAVTRVA
jgi:heptaprenyl diphosphate synthase